MNAENKGKWQIRLATLSIFLLGFLAGAFALNAYYLWFGGGKQASRQEQFQDVFNNLDLSDDQKNDVQKIFGETREKIQKMRQESEPRFQEIRAQSDDQLQKVLTAEQWQKFQQERDKIRQNDKSDQTPKPLNLK
jgi:Spy/CpxP family protein refolding chaperone